MSALVVKDRSDDGNDQLIWKWERGAATSATDLGDPTATTSYVLCVYRAGGTSLLGSLIIPPGGSTWAKRGSKGFLYRDAAGPVRRVSLRAGDDGRSRATVIGRGAALPDLAPPVPGPSFPLVVQLSNSDTSTCWEARYETPAGVVTNRPGRFKAR